MAASTSTHCRWCSAVNCSNSKNKRPDLSFFRFPAEHELCKVWVINTRRADLEEKSFEHLHKNNYLCAEHFEPCCFSKTATSRARLINGAVPTIFNVPNPPPKLTPSQPPPKVRNDDDLFDVPPTSSTQQYSPPPIPDSKSTPSFHEEDRESLKRKLCAERAKNWRLKKKLKLCHENTSTRKSTPGVSEKSTSLIQVGKALSSYL
ncbi:protein-kinase, interferon-inducible double stranded RNA-dependent inhibitor, repressor of (P58 repressor) b [Elysia marginata]|uniref:Protein-kinase, interferon-inducible double stranded RNA-dependent inhibitor, repressor of (P58 repressor) b n=1 Tax=Elysia marginata TaxID=1093978 RepID=A0AAV4J4X6_9GAST|nr:protein-kinase, interferon-inducible double stranded RNA-dependent inhibitor, repressor of (P58 repressor) b [Elysia marginata]